MDKMEKYREGSTTGAVQNVNHYSGKAPSQSDFLNAIKAEKCWAVFSWSMEKYREEIRAWRNTEKKYKQHYYKKQITKEEITNDVTIN